MSLRDICEENNLHECSRGKHIARNMYGSSNVNSWSAALSPKECAGNAHLKSVVLVCFAVRASG